MNHEKAKRAITEFASQPLENILDRAIALDNAVAGNVQILNPNTDALEIVAQRNFDAQFLATFASVKLETNSVCGRAYRLGKRINIGDITTDPYFAPYLVKLDHCRFNAVQSTPILNGSGNVIGMLSTHFAKPHYLSPEAQAGLDRLAAEVAQVIENRATQALVTSL